MGRPTDSVWMTAKPWLGVHFPTFSERRRFPRFDGEEEEQVDVDVRSSTDVWGSI